MSRDTITVGIDVGSGAVKAVVMSVGPSGERVLGKAISRLRKRDVASVTSEVFHQAIASAGVQAVDYVATTGEAEEFPLATGHFYGMTTHARGALFLEPAARAVLDIGALHTRAVAMDPKGKVLGYKMTSQCASGSGQFVENIARYLGVSLAEVGPLSLAADEPEKVSSICAVLAETDVINMVSRGISTPNILRGIHDSLAGRVAKLLQSLKVSGTVLLSGGLANDVGLQAALARALEKEAKGLTVAIRAHEDSIYAGALGAAIWGAFRHGRLGMKEAAWQANSSSMPS